MKKLFLKKPDYEIMFDKTTKCTEVRDIKNKTLIVVGENVKVVISHGKLEFKVENERQANFIDFDEILKKDNM